VTPSAVHPDIKHALSLHADDLNLLR
jgi:hypothetical protein